MTQSSNKFRNKVKSIKTQYNPKPTMSSPNLKRKRRNLKEDPIQFHLQEVHEAQNAKLHLQQISEILLSQEENLNEKQIGKESQQGWSGSPEHWNKYVKQQANLEPKLKKVQQIKIRNQALKQVYSPFNFNSVRKRYKTYSSHSINNMQKTKPRQVSMQLQKMFHPYKTKNKEKHSKQRSCASQIISVMPQLIHVRKNKQDENNYYNKSNKFALAPTFIQIPIGLKVKKCKGSFYEKAQYKRNLCLKRANNTVLIHNKRAHPGNTQENRPNQFEDLDRQRSKSQSKSNINIKSLIRKTCTNNEQIEDKATLELSPEKISQKVEIKTPIFRQFQKLKKLICGQRTSYKELGQSCPIKILGLRSATQF